MLNKHIQGLSVKDPQASALPEKAESDTCLKSMQLQELVKAVGKSGGQRLQEWTSTKHSEGKYKLWESEQAGEGPVGTWESEAGNCRQ